MSSKSSKKKTNNSTTLSVTGLLTGFSIICLFLAFLYCLYLAHTMLGEHQQDSGNTGKFIKNVLSKSTDSLLALEVMNYILCTN